MGCGFEREPTAKSGAKSKANARQQKARGPQREWGSMWAQDKLECCEVLDQRKKTQLVKTLLNRSQSSQSFFEMEDFLQSNICKKSKSDVIK